MKSNAATIRTWDLTYRICSRSPLYDDQTMFWLILRNNSMPLARPLARCPNPEAMADAMTDKMNNKHIINEYNKLIVSSEKDITTCPLNSCMFSSGKCLFH